MCPTSFGRSSRTGKNNPSTLQTGHTRPCREHVLCTDRVTSHADQLAIESSVHVQRVRLGLAGWLDWPAPSHRHCSYEPASSTSLSHKRTSNDTNQPTEQADRWRLIYETNLLSLINPPLAHIYCSTTLSNHGLIRLKNSSRKLVAICAISYF